jgi:hypothetical protein
MTSVFISGSRNIKKLDEKVQERIANIVNKGFHILIGDANGADKAVQEYLAKSRYDNVMVFCSGPRCRNNLGNWPVKKISVAAGVKGRSFYMEKDKVMADNADFGFVIWDGKSKGSLNNILNLLERRKKSLVYLSPGRDFNTISEPYDARSLFSNCKDFGFCRIKESTDQRSSGKGDETWSQSVLCF